MECIMSVVGTRPEAIKLCPLVRELRKRDRWEVVITSTGQHRAVLDTALQAFDIRPDFSLDVMREGQSLSTVAARILKGMDALLESKRPELVLVQGDTTTAFCAALSAFYRDIPVAHVEAGLRTYHMRSPFPEELHRRAIALLSRYHFAPTVRAKKNLVSEGVPESAVFITGNTVVDALRFSLQEGKPRIRWEFPKEARILIFTAHRREHLGAPMRGMFRALLRLVQTFPDLIAVCPLHPNPEVRAAAECLRSCSRIRLMEPPDTVSFHHLLARAHMVITDSGGIQEEAVALGIPTLVTRFSTERQEGLQSGVLRLAGTDENGIFDLAARLLSPGSEEYEQMKKPSRIFGDGRASARIADVLERLL